MSTLETVERPSIFSGIPQTLEIDTDLLEEFFTEPLEDTLTDQHSNRLSKKILFTTADPILLKMDMIITTQKATVEELNSRIAHLESLKAQETKEKLEYKQHFEILLNNPRVMVHRLKNVIVPKESRKRKYSSDDEDTVAAKKAKQGKEVIQQMIRAIRNPPKVYIKKLSLEELFPSP